MAAEDEKQAHSPAALSMDGTNGPNGSDVEGHPASSDAPAPFKRTVRGIRWILIILAIVSSIFLYALDNTIVADVVPSITESLGGHELLPWLSVGLVFLELTVFG